MTTAIGEMEGVAKKPAPDMVQKAMKILKTDTKKAIYVGDSEVDIQTAETRDFHVFRSCGDSAMRSSFVKTEHRYLFKDHWNCCT